MNLTTRKQGYRALLGSAVLGTAMIISGCNLDADNILDMSIKGAEALSLNDNDMKQMTDQSCAESDRSHRIAANNSQYGKRLANIKKGLPASANGMPLNFKVYLVNEPNAWAMPNGCIRVYSGLMDLMNDDEIRGVLGHEIGHVALGHTKNRFRMAMLSSLSRDMLAKHGSSTVSRLSRSQVGDLTEGFIQAQFSQSQEKAADNYSYDLHVKEKRNPMPIATAFEKLARLGSSSSLFSTHPSADSRAKNIRARIAQDKK